MYRVERALFYLFILLLPTQLGKHFWPNFSIVSGIRIDYLSPIIYVTDILLVLLVVCFIFQWIKTFKNEKRKAKSEKKHDKTKKYLSIFIFIFLFFVCNIVFAHRHLLSVYGFVKLIECAFLGFYLARTIRTRLQLQQVAFLFAISAGFESILAILQYLNQGSLNGIFYFLGERTFTGTTPGIANASINGTLVLRPYATFPHPNVLSGYLLISMVLVWSFLLKTQRRWMQVFGVVSLVLASIALLLTFSRVAILLWVLMLFILLFQMGFHRIKSLKGKLVLLSLTVLSLIVISFFPLTHEVSSRFIHLSLSDESVVERAELLAASWTMILQHPLLGVGLLNFIPSLAPLQKPSPLGLYLQPVHNIFMLVTAETGVVGLGLFIWLLAATVASIKYTVGSSKYPFFVLVVIILITGMFDHYWLTLQQGQLLFATVLGLSWTKITIKKNF